MATAAENGTPVVNGNGPKDFSLRITNLPLGIEKEGAASLFRDYGEVTGFMLLKGTNNTQQAFVSYSKYSEAERAIGELNGKPPLYLNVEFKDKNLRIQQITTDVDLSKPISDFRYKTSSINCTKVNMSKANCTPRMQPPNYTTDDELLYEVPTHPAIYNPYTNSGPYRETNLMFTRGIAYVSKDGRRHVAHGRGYTFYDLPEPHNDIGTYIQRELEKRENGYYEYATEDLEDEIDNCKICQTPTAFRCQKCTVTFYCSRTCQLSDWPKHKQECQPLPPLVKKLNKTPMQNGHRAIAPVQKDPEIQSTVQTTQELRRPKPQPTRSEINRSSTAAPPKEQKSPVAPESKVQNASPARSMKNGSAPCHSEETKNDLFKLSKPANFKAETTSFPSKQKQPQKETQPDNISRKTAVISEDDIVFQPRTFIPKDKFIKVIVTMPLSENECWVQRVEDEQGINKLLSDIRDYAKSSKTVPPEENVKCIIKTDDIYRATIISLSNNMAKVFYYDFGTWEEVEVTEVWPINGFEGIPPFARKIRLIDNVDLLKNSDFGEMILVKATGITPDGIITVQAQPAQPVSAAIEQQVKAPVEEMAKCTLKPDPPKLSDSENKVCEKLFSNIMGNIKAGQTGFMLIGNQLGENRYSATLVPENCLQDFNKLLDLLKEQCLMYKSIYNPKAGDIVSALASDENWFRGLVMSNSPIVRVALLDESRVIAPIKCVPLPEEFKKINSMGVVVQFQKGTKVPQVQVFQFTITDLTNDTAANLSIKVDDTFESSVTIQKWNPKSEQIGILVPQLNSGHEVCITEFLSQNSIHIQSLESSEKERRFKLQQEIAKYSLNRVPLDEIPVVGKIVLALFEADGNYYRAIVTKIENKEALIKYIDYGNQEIVPFNKMFALPEELKKHPTCVAEVSLKNVEKNVPLTEGATVYMQELIAGEVPLICTFDGNPLENGVQLKSPATNEIVNDKLNVLLKPSWKQDKVDDKTVYGLADLPSVKLGDVGDGVEAAFLCYYPDTGTIFFGPNDIAAATAIQVDMAEQIAKYVEVTTEHYIPRDHELCLAKYQSAFYRALCLESSAAAKESRVFFFDYGNTELVNHKDIRIFAEDFLKLGAYGSLCNISPIVPPEKFNSKISQRINEILVPNEIYEIKIISDEEDGALNIDIPVLRVALIQEKLI